MLVGGLAALLAVPSAAAQSTLEARVDAVLKRTPIIDGHNDLPWQLHDLYGDKALTVDLRGDTRRLEKPLQTDIPRLRQGRVGGQFWSVWIPAEVTGPAAIRQTLEQIDLAHAIVARYSDTFEMARTAADVRRIQRAGKIASLLGVEGGHQIDNSLAALRQYRQLGVGYMTLTHLLNVDWADSATDTPKHGGLTAFGKDVVREMNRIGMLVDLSHVAPTVMRDTLAIARAPVIFSHSGARAIVDHPRNVDDETLKLVAANGGVVMVTFVPFYMSAPSAKYYADLAAEQARFNAPPYTGLYIGQPERAEAAIAAWKAAHPQPRATLAQIADHIDHIARLVGHDHVGIGSDFDGIPEVPEGLEGVETYPALLVELARRGWTDAQLAKLAGGNILRVMERAEAVAREMGGESPSG
ncbi:dipeptidase [Sphingosinicella rhizophila]|uniref:Dipeptidase n=1 Tax=Sphingosinicella rhizophila TaxID=3050082 RepID=A0ABU3Q5Z4_9SPHN|nr:dipeptidase [Sphingosinicella sp. GR2756]MDT9598829.1 dipeptidase [Sphingosinicella sp. GR2756]